MSYYAVRLTENIEKLRLENETKSESKMEIEGKSDKLLEAESKSETDGLCVILNNVRVLVDSVRDKLQYCIDQSTDLPPRLDLSGPIKSQSTKEQKQSMTVEEATDPALMQFR